MRSVEGSGKKKKKKKFLRLTGEKHKRVSPIKAWGSAIKGGWTGKMKKSRLAFKLKEYYGSNYRFIEWGDILGGWRRKGQRESSVKEEKNGRKAQEIQLVENELVF